MKNEKVIEDLLDLDTQKIEWLKEELLVYGGCSIWEIGGAIRTKAGELENLKYEVELSEGRIEDAEERIVSASINLAKKELEYLRGVEFVRELGSSNTVKFGLSWSILSEEIERLEGEVGIASGEATAIEREIAKQLIKLENLKPKVLKSRRNLLLLEESLILEKDKLEKLKKQVEDRQLETTVKG